MVSPPQHNTSPQAQTIYQLSRQQTLPYAAITTSLQPVSPTQTLVPSALPPQTLAPSASPTQRTYIRIVVGAIAIALALILYFIWRSPMTTTSSPSITQQNFKTSSPTTTTTSSTGGDIQVYIVGAVKRPGVYALPSGSRVYQLLQAAGGPLPKANLVALNMAAKLSDGQEVYVPLVGETPPNYTDGTSGPNIPPTPTSTSTGPLVNINTASATEMQQNLHISSKTAQKIVDYRTQHGNYISAAALLQVVSSSIYHKLKDLVTV